MTRRTNLPILQHYVPQFLLREFATGKNHHVHVFDKRSSTTFVSPVKKVGAERGYYNVPAAVAAAVWEKAKTSGLVEATAEPPQLSLEPALGNLESRVADILQRLVRAVSLTTLTDGERWLVACFVAVQYVRTPHQRDLAEQIMSVLREQVGELAVWGGRDASEAIARAGLATPTDDELVAQHLRHLMEAQTYAPLFALKDWVLFRAPAGTAFFIGDNPVTLHDNSPGGRGGFRGLGLATPGAEIAIPLTPRLCLVMLAPDTANLLRTRARRYTGVAKAPCEAADPRIMSAAFSTGSAVELHPDNVTHLNARQVRFSSRYLYSADGRFELARRMIEDNAAYRNGLRIEVG